jgi:hypothetical protein
MNSDQILNLLKQIITLFSGLAVGLGAAHISVEQVTTIGNDLTVAIPALISAGSVFWSVWSHWGKKKVPDAAVAVELPKSVPVPPVGGTIDLTAAKGVAKVVG